MQRIAIIADIHGNRPALDAVLEDLAGQKVDEILVGGDLVGRGPQGSRVVARIRELGLPTIGGNHEEYVLAARRGELPDVWHDTDVWAAARFMAKELDSTHVEHLAALPFSIAREGLRLVHGTPSSNREGIGPWTADDEVDRHLQAIDEPLLVCAHTHRPLIRSSPAGTVLAGAGIAGTIVNVGSVGLPFNRDQRAQYALFTRERDTWRPSLHRVAYDIQEILAIYVTSGFLAEGGVTARLLRLEIEHATPLLVPFLAWAKTTGTPPDSVHLATFLDFHHPSDSLPAFYQRLHNMEAAGS